MNESGRRSMETAEWAAGLGTSLYVGPAAMSGAGGGRSLTSALPPEAAI
jgi:hypothetical protein